MTPDPDGTANRYVVGSDATRDIQCAPGLSTLLLRDETGRIRRVPRAVGSVELTVQRVVAPAAQS